VQWSRLAGSSAKIPHGAPTHLKASFRIPGQVASALREVTFRVRAVRAAKVCWAKIHARLLLVFVLVELCRDFTVQDMKAAELVLSKSFSYGQRELCRSVADWLSDMSSRNSSRREDANVDFRKATRS
jgi:hypothetical protein